MSLNYVPSIHSKDGSAWGAASAVATFDDTVTLNATLAMSNCHVFTD